MPLLYLGREIRGKEGKWGWWNSPGSTKCGVCPGCRGEQGIHPLEILQQAQGAAAAAFPRHTIALNCSNKQKVRSGNNRGGFVLNSPEFENAALGELQCPQEGSASPLCPLPPESMLVYKWSVRCWLLVCLLSHPPRNVPPECPGSSYFRRKPLFFFFFFPLRLTKPLSVLLRSAVKAKVYKKGNYSLTFNCN